MFNLPFNLGFQRKREEKREEEISVSKIKDGGVIAIQESISELSTIVKDVGSRLRTIEEKTRKIETAVTSLKESVENHAQEINNLKSNFDKLISIYELIANTVNPFVETPKPKIESKKENTKVEEPKKTVLSEILPLDKIERDPLTIAVVMGWLNYMVERAGVIGAKKALEYYKLVGWITDRVYVELLKYLQGFNSNKEGELNPEDHIVSLYFITKIKRGVANIESYKKIYEELVEKGIIEPKLE